MLALVLIDGQVIVERACEFSYLLILSEDIHTYPMDMLSAILDESLIISDMVMLSTNTLTAKRHVNNAAICNSKDKSRFFAWLELLDGSCRGPGC